ncbi:MAG: hypothetical protein HY077_18015 [Elusimicrobia bacterium]|nr:hypothetical protein [Elusimicrobiota bacterium]
MRALILAFVVTGAAAAADIPGAGKTVRPISIAVEAHYPLSPAVLAELALPKSLEPSLQSLLDARLDALPDFAKRPETDAAGQADWIREHLRTRIDEEIAKPDLDIGELVAGGVEKAASAVSQLEQRKRELKNLLAVSVVVPDAGDVRATRERVKERLRQARQVREESPLMPAAFGLGGAARRVERSAESATAKDPDVARAASIAVHVLNDA